MFLLRYFYQRLLLNFYAGIAQLVEHRLPKARVAGSSPVSRSKFFFQQKNFYFIYFSSNKVVVYGILFLNLNGGH